MDEDDEIIEEIPVFLSKNLQENLFLFQYPTKTLITDLNSAKVSDCFVKPINREVKIDYSLSTDSKFYDRFKGEQFAIAADGKIQNKDERLSFKGGMMDKQCFVSLKSIEDVNKYVVGIYQDKEIHLSPLTSILQLRPSFKYFDKEDKRAKAEEKAINEEDDEELQQVTVKFSRTGSSNRKTKEKTYDCYMKKITEEPWCETLWHSRSSPTSELEKNKLFTSNRQISPSLALEPKKYIEKLLPAESQSIDNMLPTKVISKSKLKLMPLAEQLKTILTDAKMLSFEQINDILMENGDKTKITNEKLLRALAQVGTLIHGNWVLQSPLLYSAESLSNSNGVCSDLMVRARDYILYKFSKTEFLHRKQIMAVTQLPPDETFEALQSVARLNSEKKWELILAPDKAFEIRHPELIQRQEMLWRATEQLYNEMESEKFPKRIRKRSIRETNSEK